MLPTQSPVPESAAEEATPRAAGQADRYLDELLSGYGEEQARLRTALRQLVTCGRRSPLEFSLPLLVHAAMTGDAGPAVPLAGVHALWWRAANTFDDVADGDAGKEMYGLPRGVALTAALECGYALPLRALSLLPVGAGLRDRLRRDYLDCWTAAGNGQLGDLLAEPAATTPEAVLATYRDKSGSVYAMAATMAARLAQGDDDAGGTGVGGAGSVAAWGRFGHLLGMLAQFRNDEDDLRHGSGEDLRNGTATYLLVRLLHSADGARHRRVRSLLAQASSSDAGRRELRAMMLTPEVLRPYHEHLAGLCREAATLLGTLAPGSPYAYALRTRLLAEARYLPTDTAAAAVGAAP
ncbi:hypothetical protein GCM10009801_17290 [Streptomyces albiaxialis]|uniref:Polyprenyl synthetase n=1 Tax=Streptomyces albiaxialis TaxID=329523 RepID=A0ABN2VQ73_9ACTN